MLVKSLSYSILIAVLWLTALCAGAQIDVLHLKSNVVDTFFGNPVADPYRWMENMGSDSVKQWLQEQKKITKAEQKRFNGRMMGAVTNIKYNDGYRLTTSQRSEPWSLMLMNSRSEKQSGTNWIVNINCAV